MTNELKYVPVADCKSSVRTKNSGGGLASTPVLCCAQGLPVYVIPCFLDYIDPMIKILNINNNTYFTKYVISPNRFAEVALLLCLPQNFQQFLA